MAWDFIAGDAIAKGELVRVTDHREIIGLAEHLVHGPHRPLPASARRFRDWLIARGQYQGTGWWILTTKVRIRAQDAKTNDGHRISCRSVVAVVMYSDIIAPWSSCLRDELNR
ncbi:hypothetical protein [Cobetia marina]|uniref:hypothetical protein n=1 Tax=Cobetia marina TaxID=28258 RepID=UPI00349F7258